MKKIALLVGLVLAAAPPARAGIYYDLTQSVSSMTWRMVGISKWFASSTAGTPTVTIDGANGGIAASSATLTATGNNIFSLRTSSGVNVSAGGVYAPFFSATTGFFGSLFGNATTATSATTATNLASGAAGSIPYQTGAGATSFFAASASKILSIVGTTPTWLSFLPTAVSISTINVSPGFNGASNFVQMDASAKLPAIDGSQLTGIAGVLAGGTANYSGRWTAANAQIAGSFYDTGSSVTITNRFVVPAGSTFTIVTTTSTAYSATGSTITILNAPYIEGGYSLLLSTKPSGTLTYLQVAGLPTGGLIEMDISLRMPFTTAGTSGGIAIRGVVDSTRTVAVYDTSGADSMSGRGPSGWVTATAGGCNFNTWQAFAADVDTATWHITIDSRAGYPTTFYGTWVGKNNDGYGGGDWNCRYYVPGGVSAFALEFNTAFRILAWDIFRRGR